MHSARSAVEHGHDASRARVIDPARLRTLEWSGPQDSHSRHSTPGAEGGGVGDASCPRQRRRKLRERAAPFQTEMRKIGDSFGTEETAALREAEHETEEKSHRCPEKSTSQARRRTPRWLLNRAEKLRKDSQFCESFLFVRSTRRSARATARPQPPSRLDAGAGPIEPSITHPTPSDGPRPPVDMTSNTEYKRVSATSTRCTCPPQKTV